MTKHLRILLIFLILIFSVSLPCSAKDLKKGSISGVLDWAKKTCEDPKVKYIWGGSHGAKTHAGGYTGYDCSGFVYWALKEGGGFDVDSAGGPFVTYTNEPSVLSNLGFKAGSLSGGWKAGDVFVSHDHTMLAAKDGKGNSAAVYHAATQHGPVKDQVRYDSSHGLSGYTVYNFKGTDTGGKGGSSDSTPYATKMKSKMADELKKAQYKYESDTTIIAITKVSYGKSNFWLSHIIVSSPNQIVFGHVQEQSKSEYQSTVKNRGKVKGVAVTSSNSYLDSVKGLLAVNGENFDVGGRTGWGSLLPDTAAHGSGSDADPGHAWIIIRKGEIYEDYSSGAKGSEICLHKDGNLSSPNRNEKATSVVSRGVKEIFASGDVRLISNTYRSGYHPGSPLGGFCKRYKDQPGEEVNSSHYNYANTIVAMVEPGNYYTATPTSGGITNLSDMKNYFWSLGCTYCKSLDSGGSVSLSFRKDNKGNATVIRGQTDASRQIPAFLYFREFKEGDDLLGGGSYDSEKKDKDKNSEEENTVIETERPITAEKDLVGMEGMMDKISDEADYVELPDGTKLTAEEKKSMDVVKESKDTKKQSLVSSILHLVVLILGIFILVYISLLWAFWIFDSVNSVITFSLVSILTFGIFRKSEGMTETDDKKELTLSRLLLVSIIAFVVSWAIISGSIYTVVQMVWNRVTGLINR